MENANILTLGIFSSYTDAESAITEAKNRGVTNDNISYVQHSSVRSVPIEVPENIGTGSTLGAFAGLGLTFIALPAYPLIIAGPILTALGLAGGAAAGALVGGLVEALVKMGFNESDVELVEAKVKEGSSVVIIKDVIAHDELMTNKNAEKVLVV